MWRSRQTAWCGREDSNFHGVSPTATSTLRVYQFRHDRTAGEEPRISPRGGVISKSALPYQAAWASESVTASLRSSGDRARAPSPTRTRSRRWSAGSPRSAPAPRPSWSGCSSIRRSTPPGPARATRICSIPDRLPVYRTGRGGRYTYHGPGQRVAYVMLDLARRGEDVHCYVHHLEEWVIRTLARFGVGGERRAGPGRHLGRAHGTGRGQDRRDRGAGAALGDLSRHGAQHRPRPRPLPRHHPLRHRPGDFRARRDLARRSRRRRRQWPMSTPPCAPPSMRCSVSRAAHACLNPSLTKPALDNRTDLSEIGIMKPAELLRRLRRLAARRGLEFEMSEGRNHTKVGLPAGARS